jgi:hypothetical protein
MQETYLENISKEFNYYKTLGENAIAQIPDNKLFWQFNSESNSVGIIVKHLSGNMLSRWTDFLKSDGEKEWRKRDSEFENDVNDRISLLEFWNNGWVCLFKTLNSLTSDDLDKIIYIRNQEHTVYEAINRQLAHYPYHIGQIVQLAKMTSNNWISLSIPKDESINYNRNKFSKDKERKHFTDES